ncbi:5'-3' exonuclease [Edaphobacter aggregans]|uniref:5'-3' exonuclease n=1 Tax=Edaphobacter aggregans TaxID=570835 RepID=UPI001FE082A7|nr:5'-3' exonuclease H3TH domain-containing protein [Edaphobacter aggregans]
MEYTTIERGATHIGVATDHVVESFRNDLYPGYKTSEGVPQELLSQFPILEEALEALGVMVWPMVHYEADDALASAAGKASQDDSVKQVIICTPDKDLSQCVVGTRVVQLDRRRDILRDEAGVVAKFGVSPQSIPDYLALVGDPADGFPGLSRWGEKAAALTLSQYPHLEDIPKGVASVASVNTEGPPTVRITVQCLERRPLVSHARDLAAGWSRL